MNLKKLFISIFFIMASAGGAYLLFPINLTRYRDVSTIVYSRDAKPLYVFQTYDDKWRLPTSLQEIDSLYLRTLLSREDKWFYYHPGVNPFAMMRAGWQWIRSGRVVSGGSTITMQTARLLEPRPRTVLSKIIECLRALQLEIRFTKDEILGIYLTLAPFGSNIEGIKAASWAYFKKFPSQLMPAEIALLVALPQSPTRLQPTYAPDLARSARANILHFMVSQKLIRLEDAQIGTLEPLPTSREGFPKAAPHLAWRLKLHYPSRKRFITTIDHHLQQQVEHTVASYQPCIPPRANVAVLVVEHHTQQALVYVGSRNFFETECDGQVDYICAYRSPGSTLKPFIYGMAFDLGLIQPDSFVLDDRQRFGAYMPGNFDKGIHGVVSVREALAFSLNIPVVHLLNEMGPVRFLGSLKEAGIQPKFGPQHMIERPSLAIALGGLGMRLEQLVTLYAALAREGRIAPISYLKMASHPANHHFLSARAAQQVTHILKDDYQEPLTRGEQRTIAFKTGTSYGHRDTLAVGYDDQYVVGVWLGIPDGTPMGKVSGRTLAVPLLRRIFKVLPPAKPNCTTVTSADINLKNNQNEGALRQSNLRKEQPRILFPVHNTVVEAADGSGQYKPILLTVSGGHKPYTWLVDGQPIAVSSWHQKHLWTPSKVGFYTITIIDAHGQSEQATIKVQ